MVQCSRARSLHVGALPEGCRLCVRGAKLVLFVTGVCGSGCYYCPLSERRREVDEAWANERPVRCDEDVVLEAERMRALGAGVTGGDPLARLERTERLVRLLKGRFGERFHVHLYTDGSRATPEALSRLREAGVDEVRFHFAREPVQLALKLDWDVGAEVPVVPGEGRRLRDYLAFLDRAGAAFCNLNELEYTDRTSPLMRGRGLALAEDACVAEGSLGLGEEVLLWAEEHTSLSVHLCPSRLKDGVQLRNRYLRTARNVRRAFERVTADGLLEKGVVYSTDSSAMAGAPAGSWALDPEKGRIETSPAVARKLARALARRGVECAVVREFPTADRYEAEVDPLR